MRLTYSQIKAQFLRNAGKAGSTDANLLANFNLYLGTRYQLILAKLADYVTQEPKIASTVASQQYYHYPPGMVSIDSISVTIGSVQYPVDTIYSQHAWDLLNALQIQPTAIPQFIFPRRDDFGIWPIPQSNDYTITFNSFIRDRNLSINDYTAGTIEVTQGSQTVMGSSTTFIPAMVGRWFSVTDPTAPGQGYWYRISEYVSATEITLESAYEGSNGLGLTYLIGESPELPEELQVALIDGVTADFYAGLRDDPNPSAWWENKFWTGSGTDTRRDLKTGKILGGLLGAISQYASRDSKHLINKQPKPFLPQYKVWSITLS